MKHVFFRDGCPSTHFANVFQVFAGETFMALPIVVMHCVRNQLYLFKVLMPWEYGNTSKSPELLSFSES